MKKHQLLLFCLIYTITFYSQTPSKKIDSLLQIAETANDSVRLRIYNKAGFYYIFNNPSLAKKTLKNALQEAKIKNIAFSEAELTNTYGIYYDVSGKSDSANFYFKKALQISKDNKFKIITAMVINNLGMFHWNKGEYQEALDYFFQALDLNRSNVSNVKNGIYLNNIGLIYQEMGLNDKSLEYHKQALKIREQHNISHEIPASLNNIAINLKQKNKYDEAIVIVKQAVLKAQEAKVYQVYYESLNTLGNIYVLTNNYKEAISVLKKINKGRDSLNIERAANLSTISNIINSYNQLNQAQKAKEYVTKGFMHIEEFPELKNHTVLFYKNASETYFRLNDTKKGSNYLDKSIQLKDSIFSLKNAESIATLETKFKVAEKEKQLAETRANLAESQLEIEQKNILIFGALGFIVILGLLGYSIYNQQKLKNHQLKKENELKTALAKIETQNKLQEQRLRISRDLHDNIGSQLTFIISSLDTLKYGLKENPISEKLSKISGFTTNTIYELRDTIWAMNKDDITFEDLQTRISNFINQAKEASEKTNFLFKIGLATTKNHSFTSLQGINLYRIIQEAVNNALKYADASEISVLINEENPHYKVSINDNGKGFNEDTVTYGNGIYNINKRAKDLGGIVRINSAIGEGTVVEVTFPL